MNAPPVASGRRPWISRTLLLGPAWFAVVGPPLVVLLLWLVSGEVATGFSSAQSTLRSLALLAGLVSYATLTTNLVLSARIPAVERLFGALDRMYRFHRRLAYAVTLLLAAHLALMLASQVAGGESLVALLLPDPGWRVFAGVLALTGLLALVAFSALARVRHETFLRVHRLFGVVFAAGALHAFRVPGVRDAVPGLTPFLLALTAVAAGAWIYRSALGRNLVPRGFWRVAALRPRGAGIAEVELERLDPDDEPLAFTPGQHVFISVDDAVVGRELHPFSITSAPGDADLRLAIKAVGDYTSALPGVERGATVRVEGPYGGFWHAGHRRRRQVWIAGGIGVTPFLSMARSLAWGHDPPDLRIDLYYLTPSAAEAVFAEELAALAERYDGLRVITRYDDRDGLVTAEQISTTSGDLRGAAFYLCGPRAMTDALTAQLVAAGVPRADIRYEEFRLGGRS